MTDPNYTEFKYDDKHLINYVERHANGIENE